MHGNAADIPGERSPRDAKPLFCVEPCTCLHTFGYIPKYVHVRSEIPVAVTVKNAVFWDVAPCDPC
jgi:hypothetical protein